MKIFILTLIFATIYGFRMLDELFLDQIPEQLKLEPITISPIEKFEYQFTYQSNDITNIFSQIPIGFDIYNNDNNYLQIISKEIILAIRMTTEVRHMKWDLTIKTNLGTLNVYSINAYINNLNIKLDLKHVKIVQNIPDRFETKYHCAKTGSRSFIIAGPRETECYAYQAKRELNVDEINKINQILLSNVPHAMLLIK